jgi:signal transduction histidine kinase
MNAKSPPDAHVDTRSAENRHFFREVEIEYLIHELKDPLAVIESGLRMLLERQEKIGPLVPKQKRTLLRVLRNTHKARDMVNGLLEIGRSQSGCIVCHSFNPLDAVMSSLKAVLEATALKGEGISVDWSDEQQRLQFLTQQDIYLHTSSNVCHSEMLQDETKFRQIFGNLVKNGLHYRRQRLEIRMTIEKTDCLCIDVADDGPGVSPEHRELIFKRYTQAHACELTSRQGHGLGLAASFIIAQCLGGTIELSRSAENGASFKMRLPLHFVEGA